MTHSVHGRNGIMHPDKKVGLALGILLIGVVASLFHRNDAPDPDREAPSLAHPTDLDNRIRHQRHTPYLPNNEPPTPEVARVAEGLVPEVAPEIPGQSRPLSSSPVPEPVRPNVPRERVVPVPAPGSDIAGLDSTLTKPSAAGRNEKTNLGTHEVVAGETLSSISLKYLGTNRRFMDVYEANRDVLRGPNDLVVGMKLKIPAKDSSAQTGTSPSASAVPETGARQTPTAGTTTTSAKPDENPNPKVNFVRPKNVPARPPTRPGKSLTQAPPPGVPSIDGLHLPRDTEVIASRPGADDGLESSTKPTSVAR